MGGYLRAMKRYAVFEGRASRGEFWQFTAILIVIAFVSLIIDGAIAQEAGGVDKKSPGGIITALVVLVHFLPSFAVTVRRLHDTNRTGWLVLLNFIPPVNLIIVLLVCLRGTPGPNQHGPDRWRRPAARQAPSACHRPLVGRLWPRIWRSQARPDTTPSPNSNASAAFARTGT